MQQQQQQQPSIIFNASKVQHPNMSNSWWIIISTNPKKTLDKTPGTKCSWFPGTSGYPFFVHIVQKLNLRARQRVQICKLSLRNQLHFFCLASIREGLTVAGEGRIQRLHPDEAKATYCRKSMSVDLSAQKMLQIVRGIYSACHKEPQIQRSEHELANYPSGV